MNKLIRIAASAAILSFVFGFTDCYKPVTRNQLPARIKTVAVPAFQIESRALRYKIESRFTDAVIRELVHRGRGLRVQGEREGADAVIEGVIKSFNFGGVLLDDKGRSRIFEVTIAAAVTVRDQQENRVLYDNQNFVFRGEYEFGSDPRSFFNEEDPAVLRMSRAFAESIVSTLINAVEVKK
ncbi:MAG TPA: LptE family protein [Pyrinomonadaceae bacterium]|nr:LptE family protein [Pyrinomonadaceae bacterium]